MARVLFFIGPALFFFPVLPHLTAQGNLEKVREEIRDDEEEKEKEKSHDDCGCKSSRRSGGFLGSILFAIFVDDSSPSETYQDNGYYVEEAPNDHPRACPYLFPDHPYPNGIPGYLRRDPVCSTHLVDLEAENMTLLPWSLRIAVENGNDFHRLNRFNGSLFLDTAIRFGFSTNWNYFHENWSHRRNDDFVLSSTNVFYRLLQSEYFTFRIGGGLLLFLDDRFNDAGGHLHLGFDLFPARPIILSGELDWGGIGDAEYVHTRIAAGVIWHSVEFYAGYDARWFDSAMLDGPFVGMRLWF